MVYVVGGTVRDILLKRKVTDVDVAMVVNPFDVARHFAYMIEGSFVPLHDVLPTARVVKRVGGQYYNFDFTTLRADTIEDDLKGRDFTINAMAIPLLDKGAQVFDIMGSRKDLRAGIIRVVDEKNLLDDPLRLLRAFRFSARLRFNIENGTLQAIKTFKSHIQSVSAERVFYELKEMFNEPTVYGAFKEMAESGLFLELFPQLKNTITNKDMVNLLLAFAALEDLLKAPEKTFSFYEKIVKYLSYEKYTVGLIKLAFLLFYKSPQDIDSFLEGLQNSLKTSKKEQLFFRLICLNKQEFPRLIENVEDKVELVKFLEKTGDAIYAIIVIVVAEMTTSGQLRGGIARDIAINIASWIDFYENTYKPLTTKESLITGADLINVFALEPSILFGKILNHIRQKTLAGILTSKKQALREVEIFINENQ
ncbi:MAG: hypothetical protein L3V56_05430 [Candidatus Magnetoovum sp. WYHC-5]|nr:hypothetical protein [Candidatus Magnetoovum sp. WYHC-5]